MSLGTLKWSEHVVSYSRYLPSLPMIWLTLSSRHPRNEMKANRLPTCHISLKCIKDSRQCSIGRLGSRGKGGLHKLLQSNSSLICYWSNTGNRPAVTWLDYEQLQENESAGKSRQRINMTALFLDVGIVQLTDTRSMQCYKSKRVFVWCIETPVQECPHRGEGRSPVTWAGAEK